MNGFLDCSLTHIMRKSAMVVGNCNASVPRADASPGPMAMGNWLLWREFGSAPVSLVSRLFPRGDSG